MRVEPVNQIPGAIKIHAYVQIHFSDDKRFFLRRLPADRETRPESPIDELFKGDPRFAHFGPQFNHDIQGNVVGAL